MRRGRDRDGREVLFRYEAQLLLWLELEDSRAGQLSNFTVARLKDGIVRDMRRLERALRLRVLRVSASKQRHLDHRRFIRASRGSDAADCGHSTIGYTRTKKGASHHGSLLFPRPVGRLYSADPRTPGRGSAGKSSSSAIAKTFGSVSAMVGSVSKPSGCAISISTSWYRYIPVPAGMR